MKHCVDINEPSVQAMSNTLGVHPAAIAAKIAVWQDVNGLDKWPTIDDITFESAKTETAMPEGLLYAEVMLPAWSAKFFKDFTDEQGNIDFAAAEKKLPSEIWDMIGYRIPTEAKYSIIPMRVVGFLPVESGGALMMPYEITTICGSDKQFNVRVKSC